MNTPASRPTIAETLMDELDLPFWEGCRLGEFRVHRCSVCGQSYWPAAACILHGGDRMVWTKASGTGVIHTFTIIHQRYHPAFDKDRPYNVIVVRLEEGPLVHSRLVDFAPEDLRIGRHVAVRFETVDADILPMFAPVRSLSP